MRPPIHMGSRIRSSVLLAIAAMIVAVAAFAAPTEAMAINGTYLNGKYFPDVDTLQRYANQYTSPSSDGQSVLTSGYTCKNVTTGSYYQYTYDETASLTWDIPWIYSDNMEASNDYCSYYIARDGIQYMHFKAGYARSFDADSNAYYHKIAMSYQPGYEFTGWKAYAATVTYEGDNSSVVVSEVKDERGNALVYEDGAYVSTESAAISAATHLDDSEAYDSETLETGTIYLVAQWEPVEYQVSFAFVGDTPDSVTAPEAQTVAYGAAASNPVVASVSGWSFDGWYTDEACTQAYDFSSAVTGNITLYGKWTESADPATPEPDTPEPDTPEPTTPDPTVPDSSTEEPETPTPVTPVSNAATPQTGDDSAAGAKGVLAAGAIALVSALILRWHGRGSSDKA
jgi:uncharacterized repeat protein (TIGR02543 family)